MRSLRSSPVAGASSDSDHRLGRAVAVRPVATGSGVRPAWWRRAVVGLAVGLVLAGTSVAALHADDNSTGGPPVPTAAATATATPSPTPAPAPAPASTAVPDPSLEPAAGEAATTEPVPDSEVPPEAAPTDGQAKEAAGAPSAASLASPEMDEMALRLLNQARAAAGLPELDLSNEARFVAAERALDMAQNGYFDHVNASGVGAVKLLEDFEVPHQIVGENIARSNYSEDRVVPIVHDALMASAVHRGNILEPRFRRAGIAVARAGDMFYFATVFLD